MAGRDAILRWSDEFDRPPGSLPAPTVWRAELGGGEWVYGQVQVYTDLPSNAAITGEANLALAARREPSGVIRSARLITKGRIHVRYGRIEARIKVPPGRGLWPAFWMLDADIDEVG